MAKIVLILSLLFTFWAIAETGTSDDKEGEKTDTPCTEVASKDRGPKPVEGKCTGDLELVGGQCVPKGTGTRVKGE